MNMLLWSTDVCGREYDATFAMLKDAGFDGVEVPIFDREVDKYAALGAAARRSRPRADRRLGAARGDDNPISEDPAVRAEAAGRDPREPRLGRGARRDADLRPARRAARRLLAAPPPTAEEKARAVAYLQEVAPYAEERGVTIALEYLSRFEMYLTNTAADLAALVREVGHPCCG